MEPYRTSHLDFLEVVVHRYYGKAQHLLGKRIDDAKGQFDNLWVGPLIGGGVAIGAMSFNPATRELAIHTYRPMHGYIIVEISTKGCLT